MLAILAFLGRPNLEKKFTTKFSETRGITIFFFIYRNSKFLDFSNYPSLLKYTVNSNVFRVTWI